MALKDKQYKVTLPNGSREYILAKNEKQARNRILIFLKNNIAVEDID